MRNNSFKTTHYRMALSGNLLELSHFEEPIYYDFLAERKKNLIPLEDENKEDSRERSRHRSRKMVKRLIYSNFGQWFDKYDSKPFHSKLLTLTFAENIIEIQEGNKQFTLFIKRLNYILYQSKQSIIQYLAVIEFQKRGAVHYHVVLFNLPFISRYIDVFNKAWGHGFLVIKLIKNEKHAASYITKYMTKEDDDRLRGNKSYFCSRDLKRPIFIKNPEAILQIMHKIKLHTPLYETTFGNEYTGQTNYSCYDIADDKNLKELIKDSA